MPDSSTTNLELVKPETGSSRDTWGAKTNANWDIVDEFIAMAMPIGAVLDFAGPNAPAGWLICDGRLISRTTYSHLFAVIGTHWGAGDGSTTFALPSTPGRSSVGPGTVTDALGLAVAFTFAQRAGVVNNYIQKAHLPNITLTAGAAGLHAHGGASGSAGSHNHTTDFQGVHSHAGGPGGVGTYAAGDHSHSGRSDLIGDHSHSVAVPNPANAQAGTYAVWSPFAGMTTEQTGVAGAHQHALTIDIAGAHTHMIYADGGHTHNISTVAVHQHPISNDGSHTHLVPLGGSGTAFSVLSPVIVVTKIIYAGAQAAPALSTMTLDATPTRRRLSAPMRGSH